MTQLRFDGKVAVVTGAGRGLGREYALLLAMRGARVIVNDLGAELGGDGADRHFAQSVVDEIVAAGGKASANFGSVADERDAVAMVQQAIDEFGGIHMLLNNAGNFTASRPFIETSTDSFNALWQVHVLGAVNTIRAAWQPMLSQGFGRIVNIGSHTGYFGHRGRFEYASCKGALHGLTMSLAMDSEGTGVNVNLVCPGAATRPVLSWDKGDFSVSGFHPSLVAPTAAWLLHEDCTANGMSFSVIAGNTSRMVIAETPGLQRRHPTPEAIRDAFAEIVDVSADTLIFPESAIQRGGQLVGSFNALPA